MSANSSVLNDAQSTSSGGIISQIPGLSPVINNLTKPRVRGRRTGILESDSDYVKLAKQGGHKDLLWHEDKVTSTANAYKPPGWLCIASEGSTPSEEKKNPGAFQPPEPPFGTDSMSAWERDYCCGNGKEKNNNVHSSQMEKFQSPSQHYQTSNFKRIVFDKKKAPVDMSKLLSFGYAEEDKPTSNIYLSN